MDDIESKVLVPRDTFKPVDFFCTPCGLVGKGTMATRFCESCEEHLCHTCVNRHLRRETDNKHTILDMPTFQRRSNIRNAADLKQYCFKHNQSKIIYYCAVHKALLCNACLTQEHSTKTCYVIYIPDESYQLLNGKEYSDTLASMQKMTEICKMKIASAKKTGADSNSFLKDALKNIKEFRQEINSRLDELEQETVKAALSLIRKSSSRMAEAKTTCDEIIESVEAASQLIKEHNMSKHTYKLFIELKAAQNMIQNYERRLSEIECSGDEQYQFKSNRTISTLLNNEKSLGTLEKLPSPGGANAKSRLTQYIGNVPVQSLKDTSWSWVTGVASLFRNRLIVIDKDNRSVKMVTVDKKALVHEMKLDAFPWDVTPITMDSFAVTLPFAQNILLIRVNLNRLIKRRVINVKGKCYGIDFCQGKFVVSFQDPTMLQIIDVKGDVLRTVQSKSSGENIFMHPNYLIANSSCIYVSDWKRHSVIQLNWQGDVIGSYEDISCPQGIALTKDGSIFVCDYSDDKCNVCRISGDLAAGKVVLENLCKPFALCWCETNNTLCISSVSGDVNIDHFIQIFRMA